MREVVDWTRCRRVHGVYEDRDRGQLCVPLLKKNAWGEVWERERAYGAESSLVLAYDKVVALATTKWSQEIKLSTRF